MASRALFTTSEREATKSTVTRGDLVTSVRPICRSGFHWETHGLLLKDPLHNGSRNFIVTGPPRALYGLVAKCSEQRKVEFSKRIG
jgi:hypothetical protein